MKNEKFKKLDEKYGDEKLRSYAVQTDYMEFYADYVRLGKAVKVNQIMMWVFCVLFLACCIGQIFCIALFPLGTILMILQMYEAIDWRMNNMRRSQIIQIIFAAVDRENLSRVSRNVTKMFELGLKQAEQKKCGKDGGKEQEKCVKKGKNKQEKCDESDNK